MTTNATVTKFKLVSEETVMSLFVIDGLVSDGGYADTICDHIPRIGAKPVRETAMWPPSDPYYLGESWYLLQDLEEVTTQRQHWEVWGISLTATRTVVPGRWLLRYDKRSTSFDEFSQIWYLRDRFDEAQDVCSAPRPE